VRFISLSTCGSEGQAAAADGDQVSRLATLSGEQSLQYKPTHLPAQLSMSLSQAQRKLGRRRPPAAARVSR